MTTTYDTQERIYRNIVDVEAATLQTRRLAGRTLYRALGTTIWHYNRKDAQESAR